MQADISGGKLLDKINSFEPIIDSKSRVLILGSMPGRESLNRKEYYAHPRNQLWKIVFALFNMPVEENYVKKALFIKSKGIALWDVIDSCYRVGSSLDSNIREEEVNDFKGLFKEYPNLKHVVFNGSKAFETFRKRIGFNDFSNIYFKQLISTSPARAVIFEKKFDEWKVIRDFLTD